MSKGPPQPPGQEWDASSYHRISEPQFRWGQQVLGRLELTGDETVIDAGCGSGRLTAQLLERLPRGHVIALDASTNMLREAQAHLQPRFGDRVRFVHADLQSLDMDGGADAIVSSATFHWVLDHPRLFRGLFRALKPGGRLVAQCGGGPNLEALHARAQRLMSEPPYAVHFAHWTAPWEFADAETTVRRLRQVGFVEVAADLEPAPTQLPDREAYAQFVTTVIFRIHLEYLPEALKTSFIDNLASAAESSNPPFLLDYWRLNLSGRKPAGNKGNAEQPSNGDTALH